MSIVKSSFWSAIGTVVKVSASFISNKLLAILTGTHGVVICAQFINFFNIVVTISNGAINNGITRFVSEHHNNIDSLKKAVSTGFRFTLFFGLLITAVLLIFANALSVLLFDDQQYAYVIRLFALTTVFQAFYYSLLAAITGNLNVKNIILVNCLGNTISLVLISMLTYLYKVKGFFLATIFSPILTLIIALLIARKSTWFNISFLKVGITRTYVKSFLSYSLMSVTTTLTMPVAQIILRNFLVSRNGIDAAGYWQGMFKISDGFLLVVVTTLNTYYLPKLARTRGKSELREVVIESVKLLVPVIAVFGILLILFKGLVIRILYSPSFLPMEELFLPQIIGDIFKTISWLLVYIMHAKMLTKLYIVSETVFITLFVILGIIFSQSFGVIGVCYGYLITYICYALYLLFIFRNIIRTKVK